MEGMVVSRASIYIEEIASRDTLCIFISSCKWKSTTSGWW